MSAAEAVLEEEGFMLSHLVRTTGPLTGGRLASGRISPATVVRRADSWARSFCGVEGDTEVGIVHHSDLGIWLQER